MKIVMKYFQIIFASLTIGVMSSLIAQIPSDTVLVVLMNEDSLFVQVKRVMDYGIITTEEKTILYRVIKSIKADNENTINRILPYADGHCQHEEFQHVFILNHPPNNQRKDSGNKSFNLFTYKSLNILISEDKLFRYNLRLDFSPWFSRITLFSIKGGIGAPESGIQQAVSTFYFGFGSILENNKFRFNSQLFFARCFDPRQRRIEREERGENHIGIDVGLQYKFYQMDKYLIAIGLSHFLDGKAAKNDIHQINLYMSLGINIDRFMQQ